MTTWQTSHGDLTALDNVILRTTVGSQVHGLAVSGTDDHDEMGVYVQSAVDVIGVTEPDPHLILRTAKEGARSYHGDTDLSLYSLRKYLSLAAQGNPSMLLPLFTPDEFVHEATSLGEELRMRRDWFVSVSAGRRHLGYLDGQRERMVGQGKQNRVPKRPELVEAYGFDTKYASHALRLGYQGIELMLEGTLTLPMGPDEGRDVVRAVKTGKYSFEGALQLVDIARRELADLVDRNPLGLPEKANYDGINAWSVDAHLWHWNVRGTEPESR